LKNSSRPFTNSRYFLVLLWCQGCSYRPLFASLVPVPDRKGRSASRRLMDSHMGQVKGTGTRVESYINHRGISSPMPRPELTMDKAYVILSTLGTPKTTYSVRRALGDEPRKRVKGYLDQLLKSGHIESPDISIHITSTKMPNLYRTTNLGESFVHSYEEARRLLFKPSPLDRFW